MQCNLEILTKAKKGGCKSAWERRILLKITKKAYELWQKGHRHQRSLKKCVQKKEKEELVVMSSNTVHHPDTVVVHFQYAAPTCPTIP
jgi:hypothetical protein